MDRMESEAGRDWGSNDIRGLITVQGGNCAVARNADGEARSKPGLPGFSGHDYMRNPEMREARSITSFNNNSNRAGKNAC
jgi:hypothetical protein